MPGIDTFDYIPLLSLCINFWLCSFATIGTIGPTLANLLLCYYYFCTLRNWCNILGFFSKDIGNWFFETFWSVSSYRCRKTLTCWCSWGTTSLRSWMGEFYELVRTFWQEIKHDLFLSNSYSWASSWFFWCRKASLCRFKLFSYSFHFFFFMQNDVYARYNEPNASLASQNEFRACW